MALTTVARLDGNLLGKPSRFRLEGRFYSDANCRWASIVREKVNSVKNYAVEKLAPYIGHSSDQKVVETVNRKVFRGSLN